jgi:hypothetical protein
MYQRSKSGRLIIPKPEPIRRYSPEDARRWVNRRNIWKPSLFTIVSSTLGQSTDQNHCTTTGISSSGASLCVILLGSNGAPSNIPVASTGDTVNALATTVSAPGGSEQARFYYVLNPTSNASYSFSFPSGTGFVNPSLAIAMVSGTASSSPFDTGNGAATNAFGNTAQPGSAGANGDIAFTGFSYNNASLSAFGVTSPTMSIIQGAGPTGNAAGIQLAWAAITGSVNPTWGWTTSNGSWGCNIATFKPSGGAAVSIPTALLYESGRYV